MKKYLLLIFSMLLSLAFSGTAYSVPAAPFLKEFRMPDGKTLNVRLIGDERLAWFESEDGYTLIKNEYGYFEYAMHDINNNLVASGIVYSDTPPPIKKHLRPSREVIASARMKMSRKARMAVPFPPSLTGTSQVLVLLIEYPDHPHASPVHEKSYFNTLYFDSLTGSVNHYFKAISYNKLSLSGTSEGWYTSINNRAYYGVQSIAAPDATGARKLVLEAVKAADSSGVNFADYDLDGDGYVDHLTIIHAGNDAAESHDADDIWSHSWDLSLPYQTSDGTYVDDYVIIAEESNLGTHVHELLHDFGAPDLYDTKGTGKPIRDWCIMAYGMYSGMPSGSSPTQLCGYLKVDLDANPSNGLDGWLNAYTIPFTQNGRYSLTQLPDSSGNRVYRIDIPLENEYFILENRQQIGYDAALPDSGVLIYHIDENMPDNNFQSINNGDNSFYRIVVEDAGNGFYHTNAAYSLEDGQTVFNALSIPDSSSNLLNASGIDISNISISKQNMTFDLLYGGPDPNEFPVAALSASTLSGVSPLTVDFTGSATDSDGYIYSYHYDFGDGQISTLQNPSHTFTNSGNYTVTLTAVDDNSAVGMANVSISVTDSSLNHAPVIILNASITSGDAPLTVSFAASASDTDGYITSYHYDFGDGETSLEQNPVHVFSVAGQYDVTLSVSDNDGAVTQATAIIKVTSSSGGGGGGGGCGTTKSFDLKPHSSGQIALDLLILMLPAFLVIYKRAFIKAAHKRAS
jgi:M6 family metalloprotease-like protein